MPPTPFPQLETPRLRLRAFAPADVPYLVALAGNYEVARNTLNIPHPYREADARHWVQATQENYAQQTGYAFAIELRVTGEFIGGIGLTLERRFDRAEAGYWLGQPYWGRGLASEALGALLRFGFEELRLNKILRDAPGQQPRFGPRNAEKRYGERGRAGAAHQARRPVPRPLAIPPHAGRIRCAGAASIFQRGVGQGIK